MEPGSLYQKMPAEATEKLFRQQKRELAILNAIIQTLSSSYNLKETLETALEMVLSVVESQTGWICLLGENNSCSAFVGQRGLCFTNDQGKPTPCLVNCVCGRVRKTRDIVVIKKLRKGCPLLDVDQNQGIIGHISVPLTTKSRVVGQLNVSFSDVKQADEMDVDLLKAIAPQLAVSIENARLWDELQEKEKLRKQLLKRLVNAQEEERRRISRELHDELGQEMTSLLVRLQVLEKVEACTQSEEIIEGLKSSVSRLLASIHDMALELRPTALDDLGLVPALSQYLRNCPENLGLEVDFEAIGFIDGERLEREVETTLYRTIQESLTNVARHAHAEKANVLLKKNEKSITAIIEDHGIGFDPEQVGVGHRKRPRLGLYGMEERIALVGGSLTIESSPGSGTTIFIEIPINH